MEIKSNKVTFNPFFDKHPQGAVVCGDEITLSVRFPSHFHIWDLKLMIEDDHGNRVKEINFNETTSFKIENTGIYWYCFQFVDCYGTHYLISDDHLDAKISDDHEFLWQLSVHEPFTEETKWFKGKIMYQIFIDRFYKGGNNPLRKDAILHQNWDECPNYKPVNGVILNNDFFGGDLQGIIKKLPYLQSLNVGVIYLNPIFEAFSNHKYDTGNYMKIDPMFGTEKDFIELCRVAKAHGIAIILDGVFNHTGDDSIYFNKYNTYDSIGAYQSKQSKYYNWYQFIDYPNDYMSWWGIKTLPSVNQDDPSYREYINQVLEKWLMLGAKGFRLDVVDELNNDFVGEIHKTLKDVNKDNVLIGEVWEDASNKVAYGVRKQYFNGNQLDTVMNYVFKVAIIDFLRYHNINHLRNAIRRIINNYPKYVVDRLMNILDTHDTKRLINNFAYQVDPPKNKAALYQMTKTEYQNAVKKMKMATILQFTLPGVPCIYYGDEVGLTGFDDPFCRRTFPWDNINQDLYEWYKILGEIRNHEVFVDGIYQEIKVEDDIFIFARGNKNESIIVIINNSEQEYHYQISGYDLINDILVNEVVVLSQTGSIIKRRE